MRIIIETKVIDKINIIWEESPTFSGTRVSKCPSELRVIKYFFYKSYWGEVISIARGINNHYGVGMNDSGFRFPSDLDPDEEVFEGVELFDLLDEMKKGIKEATPERVQGSLNNISGIRAEFDYARKQPGVTGVNQEFNFVEKTGKRRKVDIDVIADNGKTWVDVKKVKPFSLNSTDWLGHPSGKPAGVQDQARRMLGAAQKNKIDEISPQIVFDFPLGVSSEVADALKNMGVTVKGQIIKNF